MTKLEINKTYIFCLEAGSDIKVGYYDNKAIEAYCNGNEIRYELNNIYDGLSANYPLAVSFIATIKDIIFIHAEDLHCELDLQDVKRYV